MPKLRYDGGQQTISVVLPDRNVTVNAGDTISVSAAEAKRLADHPDFTTVKAGPAETSSKED